MNRDKGPKVIADEFPDRMGGGVHFMDGFDHYAPEASARFMGGNIAVSGNWRSSLRYKVRLPLQAWWRRLLRLDRPPQRVFVGFQFKGQKWHTVEAAVHTPKGTEEIEIELAFLDGAPVMIDPQTHYVATAPDE